MNKFLLILLTLGILCSGIWCASYVMSGHSDCHMDSVFSVMCVETLEHGSIISGAILTLVFSAMLYTVSYRNTYFWALLFKNLSISVLQPPSVCFRCNKPTQLQLLFARGILHPRKP